MKNAAAVDTLAGGRPVMDVDPFATCYAGHQLSRWAGQLGDGRAMSFGVVVTETGKRLEL